MGKVKDSLYEHPLCDPEVIGNLLKVAMSFEDVNGIYHPEGSIFRIERVEYDPPIQIPCLFLMDRLGNMCMLTTYDLPEGTYQLLPEGKLTDVLYSE